MASGKRRWIRDTFEVSPWSELKPAFREVVLHLRGGPVVLNDQLRWAPEITGEFLRPGRVGEPELLAAEGKWVARATRFTRLFVAMAIVGTLCLGFVATSLLLLPTTGALRPVLIMVPPLVTTGAFCLLVGAVDFLGAPVVIKVESSSMGVRFRDGRTDETPWSGIAYCYVGASPGDLGVGYRGSYRGWSARFPPAVAQAAVQRWRNANPPSLRSGGRPAK